MVKPLDDVIGRKHEVKLEELKRTVDEQEWAAQSQGSQISTSHTEKQPGVERGESATVLEKLREAYNAIQDMGESATSYACERETHLARIAELEARLERAKSETAHRAKQLEKVERELVKTRKEKQQLTAEYQALLVKLEREVKDREARERLDREAGDQERQSWLRFDNARREWETERSDLTSTIQTLLTTNTYLQTCLQSEAHQCDASLATSNEHITYLETMIRTLGTKLCDAEYGATSHLKQKQAHTALATLETQNANLESEITTLHTSLPQNPSTLTAQTTPLSPTHTTQIHSPSTTLSEYKTEASQIKTIALAREKEMETILTACMERIADLTGRWEGAQREVEKLKVRGFRDKQVERVVAAYEREIERLLGRGGGRECDDERVGVGEREEGFLVGGMEMGVLECG
ncbi:hypothetical protein HDV00_003152 [Rhizophlyctis rosea]|nr:hypothetical protein HDV00_003152 [Rhizophlyctis rosea]